MLDLEAKHEAYKASREMSKGLCHKEARGSHMKSSFSAKD